MTHPVIQCKNVGITYSYSEYRYSSFKEYVIRVLGRKHTQHEIKALSGINFQILKGESVALLGHNGSGKSTLLKVLAGIIVPAYDGFAVSGRVAPMIELGTGFDGELSGYENIVLSCALMGLSRGETQEKIESIIDFSEIRAFIDMPLKNYSSGMQARLGFACATAVDPEILLVDEVLAVGDQNFSAKCLKRIEQMRETGCTIILVSHDVNTARAFCRRGIVLENGIIKFDGDIDAAIGAHDAIMHERYLQSLSEFERSEILRKEKLEADTTAQKSGKGDEMPSLEVDTIFVQDGMTTSVIDYAKPFIMRFSIMATNPHLFNGPVSVGIGLARKNGNRIGGANNTNCGKVFTGETFKEGKPVFFDFGFARGIPELWSADYLLILGIHDKELTRTIFCEIVKDFAATNSLLGFNSDIDILKVSNYLSSVEVRG